jgi:hypothetical protein
MRAAWRMPSSAFAPGVPIAAGSPGDDGISGATTASVTSVRMPVEPSTTIAMNRAAQGVSDRARILLQDGATPIRCRGTLQLALRIEWPPNRAGSAALERVVALTRVALEWGERGGLLSPP